MSIYFFNYLDIAFTFRFLSIILISTELIKMNRIKELRKRDNVKQADLAKSVNVS